MTEPKRALVLGCGAVAGAAWQIAILNELQQRLGWDARDADILIGTSAGAVLATLLGAGVGVERMLASQRGELQDCKWNHDTDTGGAIPPLPRLGLSGAKLFVHGLRGEVSPLTAITGLMPHGRTDMQPMMNLIDSVITPGKWVPHRNTWLIAVDAESGQRVALGREHTDMPANRAVCASYAVPGVCPPVQWQGSTYLDGGIASPASADLLLGADIEEAIVLAPMASMQMDNPRSPLAKIERRVRRYMTAIVDREVAQLRAAGIRVTRIDPGPEDLAAFGFNMLDPARRVRVFEAASRTAGPVVRQALEDAC
ncbi:patatin-like phospholipase family protein [Alcanivorax sp. 1008]|uniref:patatin-like phospholipase family protein n=1 Tax=Alcanivorax sp. 1008 TaxID=2816853 RepID=UPI001D201FBF|nr:patatin-like phospholipase family protein [Alcanivorax sp. 1008]MCC1495950.1 patatin-like phospholipase family protein [Alcanivorax sp. 1008]